MARINDRNRIATFVDALVFRKNQSRYYINDEVWETEKGMEFLKCDGCEDKYNK